MTGKHAKRRRPRLGVRGKLLALVLVLLIPVLCLNAVGVWGRNVDQVTHELDESQLLAKAVSTAWVNFLENVWDMELALGSALTLPGSNYTPDEIEDLIRTEMADLPNMMVISWLSPEGMTIASSRDGRRGTSVSDREYFRRIVAGEEKTVSDVLLGRVSEQPTIGISRAIRRNGQLLGVVVAGIDLTRLGAVLPMAEPEGRRLGLLDRTGTIVFQNDAPTLSIDQRQTAPDSLGRRSLQGETVMIRSFRERDGATRMGVSVPIRPIGWALYSSVPHSVVLRTTWMHTMRDMAVLLLAAAGSLLLALYMGRSILRPILALQRAARAISAGDLSARVALSGADEVAATAQTFDSMASRIQLADEVLRARVTAVAHLSQQALAGADSEALYDAASALVALSLGVEGTLVLEMFAGTRNCRVCAAAGLGDDMVGRTVDGIYKLVAAAALERSGPWVVSDATALVGGEVHLGGVNVMSAALVPIAGAEGPFGVLAACSAKAKQFTQADLHFMQAVANVVASAVQRRRVEADQAFMARAGAVLASSLDVETTLAEVAALATESLADWCIVDLSPGGIPRRLVRSRTRDCQIEAVLERRFDLPAPGTVAHLTDAHLCELAGADQELLATLRAMGTVAWVTVPMVSRGHVLGLISLVTADPAGYDRRFHELAQELGKRAGLSLDHSQMYREATRALAERDLALRAAETEQVRLHTLFEKAPALIAILSGPDYTVAMVNSRYMEATGHRPVTGRPIFEAVPELELQGFRSLLDQVYATGEPYEGNEVRAMLDRRGNGVLEESIFNFVYQPRRDADGNVDGILVYAVDVTEQVRARQQVEAIASDLRTLARQQAAVALLGQRLIGGADLEAVLSEGITLVRQVLGVDACRILELENDGRRFRVRAGHHWTGADSIPMELDGVPTLAGYTYRTQQPVIIDDLRREHRFAPWRKLLEVGVISGVSVILPGDDEPVGVVSVHSMAHRAFSQDDVNFLVAVAHVISRAMQHQRDQQRLNTQHAVARILAEGAGGEATLQNLLQALCEGLGWHAGFVWEIDDAAGVARCTHTWHVQGVQAEALFDPGAFTPRPGEGLVGAVWQAGRPLWFSDVTAEPTFLRSGGNAGVGLHGALLLPVLLGEQVLGVIECFSTEVRRPDPAAVSMAVTIGNQVGQFLQRQRAEAELRVFNAQLEERVGARTAELRAANRELEAFAYSVSHDLRAPLRTIDGFSQALVEDFGEQVGEEGRDYIRRIRAATRNMAVLIDDILRLSRVMRQELKRQRVNLTAMAQSVVADLARERPDHAVAVTIEEGMAAQGDERLLRLVLDNLIANAWKFTSHKARAEVTVGASRQNGQTIFFVRDNGAGFDMAYADKLFVPFQRLHPSAEFEGTGIGLATVQRIVQRHGGRVWAEGRVGEGAAFYFTLQGGRGPHESQVDSPGGR